MLAAPALNSWQAKLKVKALERQVLEIERETEEIDAALDIAAEREQGLKDFFWFCKNVLGFDKMTEQLHGVLCNDIANDDLKRILVLLPRGHFKTTIISICLPLWLLCRNPQSRIALISVSADRAEENLMEIRDRARRQEFIRLYGGIVGQESGWHEVSKNKIRIPRQGAVTGPSIAAYGVDSKEVGRHFDTMLLDDICDQEKVNSQETRDRVWSWFGRQLSVLDPGCRLIVLGTRWHYDDVYSRIERQCPRRTENNPMGWTVVKRKAIENGRCIFPERFSKDLLEEIRKVQGDYLYSCFYNNEPVGEGCNPFDVRLFTWIDYVRPENSDDPEEKLQTPITHLFVDPAQSKETWACPSGLVIVDACWDRRSVIREAILEKLHPDQLVDRIFSLVSQYNIQRVGIEDEAFQKSLAYWVKREQLARGVFFTVIPVKIPRNVAGDRRMAGIQPFLHNGDIIFDQKMEGKANIIEEFETFPKGPHKDLIAAISQIPHATVYPSKKMAKPAEEQEHPILEFLSMITKRRRNTGRFSHIRVGSI